MFILNAPTFAMFLVFGFSARCSEVDWLSLHLWGQVFLGDDCVRSHPLVRVQLSGRGVTLGIAVGLNALLSDGGEE